jgi:hypothetical protein
MYLKLHKSMWDFHLFILRSIINVLKIIVIIIYLCCKNWMFIIDMYCSSLLILHAAVLSQYPWIFALIILPFNFISSK